jgi:hypothetical protein
MVVGFCALFAQCLTLANPCQPKPVEAGGPTAGLETSAGEFLADAQSLDVAESDSVVVAGKPGPQFFNYQAYLTVSAKGTWICCWTQGTTEAASDQRVVAARSLDQGRMWSAPAPIEEAAPGYRVPAWVTCYSVPGTGRVYAFYWYNSNGEPLRDAGDIFYKYSDDEAQTWSVRYPVRLPRSDIDDTEGEVHGWNFGQPRLLETGQVIMTFTKIRRSSLFPKGWRLSTEGRWLKDGAEASGSPPTVDGGSPNNWETEVFLLECVDIMKEQNAANLKFRVLPGGRRGLSVPYPGTSRPFGQEGSVVSLSKGRLLCVFRTRQGSPYFVVSDDGGQSWTTPEVLRRRPGGDPFPQPCAPCPIHKTADGRVILLFHNAKPNSFGWHPRHPLWIAVGHEDSTVGGNAGLVFSAPRELLHNDQVPGGPFKDAEISYPQYYEIAGRQVVVYANKTSEIRISQIPSSMSVEVPK